MSKEGGSIRILKKVVIDGLLLCGLVACLYAVKGLWVPFKRGFFCGDESLMYPYQSDTVTVYTLKIYGLVLPILAFLIFEWSVLRKEKDDVRCLGVRIPAWVRGFYCTLVSFGFGVCFSDLATEITKRIIGRPRPHFFDVCKPSINCTETEYQNKYIVPYEFRYHYGNGYSYYECTGDRVDLFQDMNLSFLSGHSSWAAYTMIFLAMYLQKRMIYPRTRTLRHSLQFLVIMISWYTAMTRISDFKHHWSDVLVGYFMGLTIAVVVWRWGTDLVKPGDHQPSSPTHHQGDVNHQGEVMTTRLDTAQCA